MNTLSLRAGYKTNSDENGWSFGVGISKFGFDFDYSYTSFSVFNKVQRFTAGFMLSEKENTHEKILFIENCSFSDGINGARERL